MGGRARTNLHPSCRAAIQRHVYIQLIRFSLRRIHKMAPNKRSPSLPPFLLPASPRGGRFYTRRCPSLTLRLHWPSGEFIVEDVVSLDDGIERYYQHLEEGLIAPEFRIDDETHGDRDLFHYVLVCNGIEVLCGRTFEEVVEEQGITVEEPVEVMVVLMDSDRFLTEFIELNM